MGYIDGPATGCKRFAAALGHTVGQRFQGFVICSLFQRFTPLHLLHKKGSGHGGVAVGLDGRTVQSSCESGPRAGYDGYKRRRGSKVHMAVDTLGHLLAVHITPANEQERAQVQVLCEAVQQATGGTVKLAWADQGYTGEEAKQAAQEQGIDLQVVKLPEAKKGFVLLPRRWVVERSFGWLARFRRLSRDYERLPEVLAGMHFVVFLMLMLPGAAQILAQAQSS